MRQPTARDLLIRQAIRDADGNVAEACRRRAWGYSAVMENLKTIKQSEWWTAEKKRVREKRRRARAHRKYEARKVRASQRAAGAYYGSLYLTGNELSDIEGNGRLG